jgi:glycerophosphoryl diester phosphodiesterase
MPDRPVPIVLRTALLLLVAVVPAVEAAGAFPFFEPVRPRRRVQVMAHRGAMGQAPENTAEALERSIGDGIEWVEVDVRLTRGGQHILFHDETLERMTDGSGPVAALTLEELKRLDAGSKFARRFASSRILTLSEALHLAKGRVNLYLDCKKIDAPKFAREILDAGMEAQAVVFGPPDLLWAVRSAPGGDRLGLMPKWHPQPDLDALVDVLRPAAVELDAAEVTPERCRAFHDRGIIVQAKALGDADDRPEVWDRVIAAGVDWIQTDLPEEILAREVLKKVGQTRVKVAYHRGASRYAPENTFPALEKAVRLGADFVEFDVRTTRDGGLFLLHDNSLDRTTTGLGPIRALDSSNVAGLDAGSRFGRRFAGTPLPTLDGFLRSASGRVELYFDAKDITPEALVSALRDRGLIERAVVYQRPEYLVRLREVDPRVRRMPPLGDLAAIDALAARVKPYAFDTRWSILSKPLIDRCHALGIKVFSDALGQNESVERYRRAIEDGIDLIQTDHPVRVLRAIELHAASSR